MKNNKGINLISLVIMIIIMIILAAVAINISMNSYDQAIRSKQAAERQQVVSAVQGRFGDYTRNSTANPLLGLRIYPEDYAVDDAVDDKDELFAYLIRKFKTEYGKLVTDEELANGTQAKEIEEFVDATQGETEYTRILVSTDLLELGIENTTLQAVYLVNYYTNDVVGPIN